MPKTSGKTKAETWGLDAQVRACAKAQALINKRRPATTAKPKTKPEAKPRFTQVYFGNLGKDLDGLNATAKVVLMCAIFEANFSAGKYRDAVIKTGQLARSLTQIAAASRCGLTATKHALKDLVKRGLLVKTKPWGASEMALYEIVNYGHYARNEPRICGEDEDTPLKHPTKDEPSPSTPALSGNDCPPPCRKTTVTMSENDRGPLSENDRASYNTDTLREEGTRNPPLPPEKRGEIKEIEEKEEAGSVVGDTGSCNTKAPGFGYEAKVPARQRALDAMPPNPVFNAVWQMYPVTSRGTALSARQGFERWHSRQDPANALVFTIEYHRAKLHAFLNTSTEARQPHTDAVTGRPTGTGVPELKDWFETGLDRDYDYAYSGSDNNYAYGGCFSVLDFEHELGLGPGQGGVASSVRSEMDVHGSGFDDALDRVLTGNTLIGVADVALVLAFGRRQWRDLDACTRNRFLFALLGGAGAYILEVCGGLRQALVEAGVDPDFIDHCRGPEPKPEIPVLEYLAAAVAHSKLQEQVRDQKRTPEAKAFNEMIEDHQRKHRAQEVANAQ